MRRFQFFFQQSDFLKALYAFERKLFPAIRRNIHIPLNDLNQRFKLFSSQLSKFSDENTSIILYLNDDHAFHYNNKVNCWAIYSDQIHFFCLLEQDQSLSKVEINDRSDEFQNLSIPTSNLGIIFRKLYLKSQPNLNSVQVYKFLNFARKQLWDELCSLIAKEELKEAKRIIVIPDHRLHLIPYALLGNTSASTSLEDYPLLNSYTISIAPSFWALSHTWMKSEREIPPKTECSLALLIGNPENNLPAAEEEVSLVAESLKRCKELNVLSLTQHLATKDIIIDSLVRSKVVHFAAHGDLNTSNQHILPCAIQLVDQALLARDIEVCTV